MPSTEINWKIPTDTHKGNRPNPCCSQVVWKRINKNSIISTLVFSQNRVSLLVCLDSTRDADVPFFRAHSKSAPSRSFCDPGPSTPPAVRSKSTFFLFPLVALYFPDPLDVLYTKLLSVHVIEASWLALKATATAKTPLFRKTKERSPVVPELSRVIFSFKRKWNWYSQYSLCSRRHCDESFGIHPFHFFYSRSS